MILYFFTKVDPTQYEFDFEIPKTHGMRRKHNKSAGRSNITYGFGARCVHASRSISLIEEGERVLLEPLVLDLGGHVLELGKPERARLPVATRPASRFTGIRIGSVRARRSPPSAGRRGCARDPAAARGRASHPRASTTKTTTAAPTPWQCCNWRYVT